MATERNFIINARVNTGNSAKDLKQVDDAVKGVNKTTETAAKDSGNYAKQLDEVRKQSQQGGQSLRQLNKVIQQYQAIALEAGANSPIGRQAIEEAAVLRDRIDQVSLATRRLADDGANVQAALQLGTGVVQGYQGVLGVTTLLGVENENLIETLTKLQAAQGVVNSLQAVQQALAKESVLVLKAQALGTGALSAAQAAYAAIVGTSTGALKLFRLALIGTGIGAAVVAIGALIANFESVKNVVLDVIDFALTPFKNALQVLGLIESDEEKERKKRHDNELNRRIEAGREAQKEVDTKIAAMRKEKSEFERTGNLRIRLLRAEGASKKDIFEAEQQLRRETIERSRTEGALLVQKNKLLTSEFLLKKKLGKLTKEEAEEINAQIEANNAAIRADNELRQKLTDEIKVANVEFRTGEEKDEKAHQERLSNIRKQARDKEEADRLQREEEEKKRQQAIRDQEAKDRADLQMQIAKLEDEFLQTKISKENQELNAVQDKYNAIIEAAREAGEDVALLEEAQQQAMLDIQKRFADERAALEEQQRAEKAAKDKEAADQAMELEMQIMQFRRDAAVQTFNVLGELAATFAGQNEKQQKRAFQVQKAAAIANGLVLTYESAIAAYRSQLQADPTAPIRAAIAASIAGAAGLANVAKISKQQFNASGGGAAGGSVATGGSTSQLTNPQQQISLFGQANEGSEIFAENTTANATNITVTAQVVETDMTATQQEVEGIQQLATL